MVQSTDPPSGLDQPPWCRTLLCGAPHWSILVDSEVSPVLVVVGPVFLEQAPKVLLVKNDDVIEQLPPYRAHQALGDPVLPGTLVAGPLGCERHGGGGAEHFGREDGIAVEEKVPGAERYVVEGECLTELLDDPGGSEELGDAPVQDLAPNMPDGEPDIEQAEGSGGNHEEIHRDDELSMVPQKGEPTLPLLDEDPSSAGSARRYARRSGIRA